MKKTIAQEANARASAANIPLSGFIEITRACNHGCYHCYQGLSHARGRELTSEQWNTVLSQIADAGGLYLAFSGGEPFLRPDFMEILRAARTRHFAVSVVSNGSLINEDTAARLSEIGVMDVGISFHASYPELHDSLAGFPGSFGKAIASLRHLSRIGIKTIVKHCVSSENFGEYRKLALLAEKEGAALECDSTVLPDTPGRISSYALSVEQHKIFMADMQYGNSVPCPGNDGSWTLHCDAGRSMYGITSEGSVVPCIILPVVLGNVREKSFAEIWNGAEACLFRKNETRIETVCEDCSLKAACSRCHAVAYMETGNWRADSPGLCARAKASLSEVVCR